MDALNKLGDDNSPLGIFLAVCCVGPIICSLLGAIVAYFVFGIIFLIDDKEICSDMSPLWIFALIAIISPCFSFFSTMIASELRQCVGGTGDCD